MSDSWEENQKKLQASSEKLFQRWKGLTKSSYHVWFWMDRSD